MARAARTCSRCPAIIITGTRCPTCSSTADKARRPDGNPYDAAHRKRFRAPVLARDPICVMPNCWQWATVADHYPRSRRELIEAGEDPNDPRFGRGLCHRCHSIATANNPAQVGGWNARDY